MKEKILKCISLQEDCHTYLLHVFPFLSSALPSSKKFEYHIVSVSWMGFFVTHSYKNTSHADIYQLSVTIWFFYLTDAITLLQKTQLLITWDYIIFKGISLRDFSLTKLSGKTTQLKLTMEVYYQLKVSVTSVVASNVTKKDQYSDQTSKYHAQIMVPWHISLLDLSIDSTDAKKLNE